MPEFVSVENVRISLLPATLFQRFAAITIDIIFTLIFLGISALVGSSFIRSGDEWMIVLYCLFFFFLPVLEEITFNGRTIGKLCLRLRVVQIDGSAPTARALILRSAREAFRHGADSVNFTSRPSRTAANNLYVSLGFEQRETNVYRCKQYDSLKLH